MTFFQEERSLKVEQSVLVHPAESDPEGDFHDVIS